MEDCHDKTDVRSVTERRNPVTTNIDVASPSEIVDLLYKCDKEIFDGWEGSDDPEKNAVVVSGCGTSGRLAFMTARSFNAKMKETHKAQCYKYLIAGGDRALFQAQEAFEDDPYVGKDAFQKICEGKKRVLLIGVTCGLSAAYVAGQLDQAMDNTPQCVPVLLGFSPISLVR
ncbi:Glucokinase regulatory protein [Lamellibrachia satsuma]|nr:Glucokinase regulatory protein [Lamellibrachia satsuma]